MAREPLILGRRADGGEKKKKERKRGEGRKTVETRKLTIEINCSLK